MVRRNLLLLFALAVTATLALLGRAPEAVGAGDTAEPTSLILLPFRGDDATKSALGVGKRIFEARVTATGRFGFIGDQESQSLFDASRSQVGVSPEAQREADLAAARRSYAKFAIGLAVERLDKNQYIASLQVWDPAGNALLFTDNEVVNEAGSVGAAARVGLDALAKRFLVSPVVLGLAAPAAGGLGRLDVLDVQPSPLEVFVNGNRAGTGPAQLTGLPVGTVAVELRAVGYAPYTTTLELSASEVATIRGVRLVPADVTIEIRANLDGAAILVDGNQLGVTAAGKTVAVKVISTARQLKVTKQGYRTVSEPLNLLGSTMRRFDISLETYAGPDGRSVETADCQRSSSKDGARLCRVPAGDFLMGQAGGTARSDEAPQRTVTLSRAFDAYATEVTVSMYRKCVEAGGCKAPGLEIRGSAQEPARENAVAPTCNYNAPGRGDAPMNCVNYYGAADYCAWAGAALPSEAQWEYAARGVDGRLLPWGAMPANASGCDYAGFAGCSDTPAGGSVVGEHPLGRSPFGLNDVAGNVAEWVRDTYESGAYATLPKVDPLSDTALSRRVVRGGSAMEFATGWSVASRSRLDANARVAHVGFRCIVEAP